MKGYDRDNVKLSYNGEPKYYINEKMRTVTCTLKAILGGPTQLFKGWIIEDGVNFPSKELTATATAYCHEDDTFDIERGKRIALSRAENELYAKALLQVSEVAERLDFMRKACNSFVKKSIKCQSHNLDYIDSLSVKTHPMYKEGPLPKKRGTVVQHIKVKK